MPIPNTTTESMLPNNIKIDIISNPGPLHMAAETDMEIAKETSTTTSLSTVTYKQFQKRMITR